MCAQRGDFDIAIIGGGIVGVATAKALSEQADASLVVLEAEDHVAAHQTGHNSGVIHSGIYYKPGSLKARLCKEGREALYTFCKEHDVSHERQEGRSIFRARIESEAKVQIVKAWYVYSDDLAWRDLMWYHLLMVKDADRYEAVLGGKVPDAFMVEVGDISGGIPGYVSSLPQKLTDAPVIERRSRGSRPRLWQRE